MNSRIMGARGEKKEAETEVLDLAFSRWNVLFLPKKNLINNLNWWRRNINSLRSLNTSIFK